MNLKLDPKKLFSQAKVTMIPKVFGYLFYKLMPYLTRLPIFEDYWRGSLGHYKNRHLLQLTNLIEGNKLKRKFFVYFVDVDAYHNTFYFKLQKPTLTPTKAKIHLNRVLQQYFGEVPDGVIIKLKRTYGQVLIPVEMLKTEFL